MPACYQYACADPQGGQGVQNSLKNPQNIGFLSNTGQGPLKNHKAANLVSIQCLAINGTPMAIRSRANDGLLIVVFGSPLPLMN